MSKNIASAEAVIVTEDDLRLALRISLAELNATSLHTQTIRRVSQRMFNKLKEFNDIAGDQFSSISL